MNVSDSGVSNNLNSGFSDLNSSQPGQIGQSKPVEKKSFKEAWSNIQTTMGAKPEPQREIKKSLGKDDFLRIMISQMKNQDPTKPFEAEKLGSEIAQIANIEQLGNMTKAVQALSTKDKPMERMAMTNLIGKNVIIDQNRFEHNKGTNESLLYELPENAREVKIRIFDSVGNVIVEKNIGSQKEGKNAFTWDGKKDNTLLADQGSFHFEVEASSYDGKELKLNSLNKSRIVGVSFENDEAVLLVGDEKNQQKVALKSIIKIQDDFNKPNIEQSNSINLSNQGSNKNNLNNFSPIQNKIDHPHVEQKVSAHNPLNSPLDYIQSFEKGVQK